MNWAGVMPAMTTAFDSNYAVDHTFLAQHCAWLLGNGCTGLVMLGSLGEGATIEPDEKIEVLKTAVRVANGKAPIVASISSLSTATAVKLAQKAEQIGCQGLLVLPPYIYSTDWREMKHHVSSIIGATKLSCMLYNNPISYTTDFLPEQIAELARQHDNLHAVKESSSDVRRVAAIRALLDDRLAVFVGVDDVIVESIGAGAKGWIAGLVNAFPAESVELFNLAQAGKFEEAYALYRWFLPLLRMDTLPKLVQYIKWAQGELSVGSPRVRAPRLELEGAELAYAQQTLRTALQNRPKINQVAFSNFKGA